MKPILYAALLLWNASLFLQTYDLDRNFGNSGTMQYASISAPALGESRSYVFIKGTATATNIIYTQK